MRPRGEEACRCPLPEVRGGLPRSLRRPLVAEVIPAGFCLFFCGID